MYKCTAFDTNVQILKMGKKEVFTLFTVHKREQGTLAVWHKLKRLALVGAQITDAVFYIA